MWIFRDSDIYRLEDTGGRSGEIDDSSMAIIWKPTPKIDKNLSPNPPVRLYRVFTQLNITL